MCLKQMIGAAEWVSLGINFSGLCYEQRSGLSPLDHITKKATTTTLNATRSLIPIFFDIKPFQRELEKMLYRFSLSLEKILFARGSNISNISEEKYS